jgi:hypothetical protein
MRISIQTLKFLIAIAGIVIIFSVFQVMTFDMFGIVWPAWGYMMVCIFIICLFFKVPQGRRRPLVYLYPLIGFVSVFAAFSLRRHPRALEILLMAIAIPSIIFIVACIVAIFYPERRNPR